MTTGDVPRTARARARADITREIVTCARRHLDSEGAAGLSLRAVARDLGMVSSAVYRYVPSRDALLTTLLIEGYVCLGEAVEVAEARARRSDVEGRWLRTCRATRRWACERPQEWALLYGSPVPGYAAPPETIEHATRIPLLLVRQLVDAVAAGGQAGTALTAAPPRLERLVAPTRAFFGNTVPVELVVRGLIVWTHLVGAVSFELFGHRVGSTTDDARFFDEEMRRMGAFTGLYPG